MFPWNGVEVKFRSECKFIHRYTPKAAPHDAFQQPLELQRIDKVFHHIGLLSVFCDKINIGIGNRLYTLVDGIRHGTVKQNTGVQVIQWETDAYIGCTQSRFPIPYVIYFPSGRRKYKSTVNRGRQSLAYCCRIRHGSLSPIILFIFLCHNRIV